MLEGGAGFNTTLFGIARTLVRAAESADVMPGQSARREDHPRGYAAAVTHAARVLAEDLDASAIVGVTRSGLTAELLSRGRARVPIFAFSPDEAVTRRLALWWGVIPRYYELTGTIEQRIASADLALRESGMAQLGDEVVIMGGMPSIGRTRTNFVKLHRIGELEERPN